MEERTECGILYWVFEDEISTMRSAYARNYQATSALDFDRSTDRPATHGVSMVPFFIYVRGATTGRGISYYRN